MESNLDLLTRATDHLFSSAWGQDVNNQKEIMAWKKSFYAAADMRDKVLTSDSHQYTASENDEGVFRILSGNRSPAWRLIGRILRSRSVDGVERPWHEVPGQESNQTQQENGEQVSDIHLKTNSPAYVYAVLDTGKTVFDAIVNGELGLFEDIVKAMKRVAPKSKKRLQIKLLHRFAKFIFCYNRLPTKNELEIVASFSNLDSESEAGTSERKLFDETVKAVGLGGLKRIKKPRGTSPVRNRKA